MTDSRYSQQMFATPDTLRTLMQVLQLRHVQSVVVHQTRFSDRAVRVGSMQQPDLLFAEVANPYKIGKLICSLARSHGATPSMETDGWQPSGFQLQLRISDKRIRLSQPDTVKVEVRVGQFSKKLAVLPGAESKAGTGNVEPPVTLSVLLGTHDGQLLITVYRRPSMSLRGRRDILATDVVTLVNIFAGRKWTHRLNLSESGCACGFLDLNLEVSQVQVSAQSQPTVKERTLRVRIERVSGPIESQTCLLFFHASEPSCNSDATGGPAPDKFNAKCLPLWASIEHSLEIAIPTRTAATAFAAFPAVDVPCRDDCSALHISCLPHSGPEKLALCGLLPVVNVAQCQRGARFFVPLYAVGSVRDGESVAELTLLVAIESA